MESAGSQQQRCCCFPPDAQHPQAGGWEKPAGVTPGSLRKQTVMKAAKQPAVLPCRRLSSLGAGALARCPRAPRITMTGGWEGASSATLVSPSSAAESLSGDIPPLLRFLISSLICFSPGSLRLNIMLATTRGQEQESSSFSLPVPGTPPSSRRKAVKKKNQPGNFSSVFWVFFPPLKFTIFPLVTEK